MREGSVKKFLFALGCENLESNGEWVKTKCPLAPYTHAGGSDSRPSFGVSISNEGESVWYCFACSPKGQRLGKLLHDLWVASGRYEEKAAKIFLHEENHETARKRKSKEAYNLWESAPKKEMQPLPRLLLDGYPLLKPAGRFFEERRAVEWLVGERGITEMVYTMCRVRLSAKDSAVVFPLTDTGGRIFVIRFRSRKGKAFWTGSKESTGVGILYPKLKNVGVWFGMHLADWDSPLILTEGELDAMRLMSLGWYNVIASATSSVTDAQINSLPLRSSPLFLGYDADKAGLQAHKRITDMVSGKVNLYELDWGIVEAKDAGELKNRSDLEKVLKSKKAIT